MQKKLSIILPVFLAAFTACSSGGSSSQETGSGGAGTGAGGTSSPGTGGSAASGGSTSAGGSVAPAMGGAATSGGTYSTGGNTAKGGSLSSGGASSGGMTSAGGETSAGGIMANGGSESGGFAASNGGNRNGGSAAGGMAMAGGNQDAGVDSGRGGNRDSGAAGTAANGGTTSSGGSTGAGGGTGVCAFASGLNVAWVNFANDVPNPNLATFNTIFKNTYAAGGRVIRWWFHTNGTVTPGYDSSGMAQKIPQTHIDGVKAILNAAATNKVAINISLWSFDMLQGGESISATTLANNAALLSNDTNRQAYIDNYLTPLITALKGTPGLYSYEIFNEPEGMSQSGWTTSGTRTTEAYIQKTVNWLAAAIHTADPTALVTNAAQTFDYCSNGVSGKTNDYSDTALRNAGGKQNGTLDFYEVHYYTSNGASDSCFTYPASHWGLTDKKLVMGEFAAAATDGTALNDLYTKIYSNGYDGAWAWSYDADWQWPDMQTPMQNLYTAQQTVVNSCP